MIMWRMQILKRTKFDDEFDEYIWSVIEKLTYFNTEAISRGHPDIRGSSNYVLEILDTLMSNRTEE